MTLCMHVLAGVPTIYPYSLVELHIWPRSGWVRIWWEGNSYAQQDGWMDYQEILRARRMTMPLFHWRQVKKNIWNVVERRRRNSLGGRGSFPSVILCLASRQNIIVLFVYSTFTVRSQNMIYSGATIDCLTADKTKKALHNEAVILNYIGGEPINHGLSN